MRKPDPAEIVAVTVPLLVEVVVVLGFIAMLAVWCAIGSGA